MTFTRILPLAIFPLVLSAQGPRKPTSAEILQDIRKLSVLGSVLYVAAHPDDENTRLIAYLSKVRHYDVTYISLTRGDGGQNLIGTELREQLGVLRSQELQMARRIDGGKQLFSRANDFGYSKTPKETFQIWNKDQVMEDMLYAIRMTQPDVIINRFSYDDKIVTHGHHTASAMLSVEAFDLSAKQSIFPDQVTRFGTWQPERLFTNISWFFYGREAFDKMDKSHWYTVDIGTFLPLLGKSVSEIAAEARSQHKCQGFGMLSTRGTSLDYMEYVKGSRPKAGGDIFDGINTSWSRLAGGAEIGAKLNKIEAAFDPSRPETSVPALLDVMDLIGKLPESKWKETKLKDIKEVIKACLGIYLETSCTETTVTPSDSLTLQFEAINRSGLQVQLVEVRTNTGLSKQLNAPLDPNVGYNSKDRVRIPENIPFSSPFWLMEPWSVGTYQVSDPTVRLLPESPDPLQTVWVLEVQGKLISYIEPLVYKKGEPAIGEVFEPLEVLPPVVVSFARQALYSVKPAENVVISVTAHRENEAGSVRIKVPEGWQVSPSVQTFQIAKKGGTQELSFTVKPPKGARSALLTAEAEVRGKKYHQSLSRIKYDHIPQQQVLMPAQMRFTPVQVKNKARRVGYVMGAGDEVPDALTQIGCKVTLLDIEKLDAIDLKQFDCIQVGIRAYNTKDALKHQNPALLRYVKNGGVLIVHYNTTGELVLNDFAPYTLKLGRDRITEEDATLTILEPNHPLMQTPNRITQQDFEGWVQERGLYFPKEWGPEFTPLLSGKDSNETTDTKGALLVARYGKGTYIYTGLSFFRELPEGVPGAMRLMANLMSAGK